ncbi:MAG: CHASE2 domain-containing protein [Acidobacteriota bacterium]
MPRRHTTVRHKSVAHNKAAHSSLKRLFRPAIIIVVVSLITLGLEEAGWLRGFETAALDTWLRLKAPLPVNELIIVGITNDDYRDLFDDTSPLKPEKLDLLLDAIARGGPKVIGVDIDTSSRKFWELQPREKPPVVWAVDAILQTEGKLEASAALGGKLSPGKGTGIAALPQDSDGVVRSYRRVFATAPEPVPSFPWAVVTQYREVEGHPAAAADEHDTEDVILNFSGYRYSFSSLSAKQVLELSDGEGWSNNGPLGGRIVLLGGRYRAARDEYVTPLGPMAGVDLMAQAIASELRGGGIGHANKLLMLLLEIIGGACLVFLNRSFSLGWAVLLSCVGVPVLALAGSFFAFSSLAYWANFVPILVSVLIHELYERAREHWRMYEALKGLGKLEEQH